MCTAKCSLPPSSLQSQVWWHACDSGSIEWIIFASTCGFIVPMVGVSLQSSSQRALTILPYNELHLMCSATVVGAVTYPFIFSWNLVVNGSGQVAVTDGINTTDSFPPVGLSLAQVTLTSPGVYVYSCSVTISEASEISGTSQTTITVSGEYSSSPCQ